MANVKEQKEMQVTEVNEELESIAALAATKLLACWGEIQYFARLARIPREDQEEVPITAILTLATNVAIEAGIDRDDFLKEMAERYDETMKEFAGVDVLTASAEPTAQETLS